MIALDTNALVRLLVDSADAPEQSQRVRSLIAYAERAGQRVYIGEVVLAELSWVLTRALRLPRQAVQDAVGALLDTPIFVFDDAAGVAGALAGYAAGGPGLADLLIAQAARRMNVECLYTFDQRLLKLDFVRQP